ncbi:hypothetical protein GGX14DRAFT_581428 [Mycena pura]|uniref:Uncharacterized protein n=1 Tax=Mycena pura TaxID=153505 RepID=A0AAD6YU21_9AGAR|nr:hypothetical protein GGX14DRAFT_581428 [Mycena pura]
MAMACTCLAGTLIADPPANIMSHFLGDPATKHRGHFLMGTDQAVPLNSTRGDRTVRLRVPYTRTRSRVAKVSVLLVDPCGVTTSAHVLSSSRHVHLCPVPTGTRKLLELQFSQMVELNQYILPAAGISEMEMRRYPTNTIFLIVLNGDPMKPRCNAYSLHSIFRGNWHEQWSDAGAAHGQFKPQSYFPKPIYWQLTCPRSQRGQPLNRGDTPFTSESTHSRTLPANMSFKLIDASRELPFEPDFDIVLNAAKVIERAARLLKPGGLLLLEDFDISSVVKTGGPAAQRWTSKYIELCTSRGMDPELGRKLEKIMSSAIGLSRVHVHKLSLPMNGAGSDENLNDLGRALRTFYIGGAEAVTRRHASHDFTDGMLQDYITEVNEQDCTALFDMYFCWAHRTES